MKTFGLFFIIFGLIIIIFPEFLAYLIGGFFLFLGINILVLNYKIFNFTKNNNDERGNFIKIGKYKIYK